jgi:hypothetical protein
MSGAVCTFQRQGSCRLQCVAAGDTGTNLPVCRTMRYCPRQGISAAIRQLKHEGTSSAPVHVSCNSSSTLSLLLINEQVSGPTQAAGNWLCPQVAVCQALLGRPQPAHSLT